MQFTRFATRASGGSAERVIDFLAHLRGNGIATGVADTAASLRSLQLLDLGDWQETRSAFKAICCSNADDYKRFDDLFDAYWRNHGLTRSGIDKQTHKQPQAGRKTNRFSEALFDGHGKGKADTPDDKKDDEATHSGGTGKLIASTARNIEKTDLRELMTPQDLAEAAVVAERLASALRDRRSRRKIAARKGARLDLAKVARASISYGGEPLKLYKKRRPDRPVRIVALLDVSGSMQVYSKIFLAFLRGLTHADEKTDACLFHTSLVRISDALRDHDTLRAVNRLSIMAQGFGGGTKIGACLQQFNHQYASNSVNSRSVVIILSDGYDTGQPQAIADALERIKNY